MVSVPSDDKILVVVTVASLLTKLKVNDVVGYVILVRVVGIDPVIVIVVIVNTCDAIIAMTLLLNIYVLST